MAKNQTYSFFLLSLVIFLFGALGILSIITTGLLEKAEGDLFLLAVVYVVCAVAGLMAIAKFKGSHF